MGNAFLEQKTEDELWIEYKKTRSPSIREFFIKQYAPLVKYVAGKLAVGMPESVEFDDLVGFGVFGLLDAIDKFDAEKNVKFKTYAVTRIRGAIFDELRSIDWVPRSVRQKTREIEDTVARLESNLGRSAEDSEIASALGVSEEEYQHMRFKTSVSSIVSIDDTRRSGEDSEHLSIADSLESPASMKPDVIVERDEVKRVVAEAINELPEKEKMVLILYYYEDLTLREIGQVLKVTESRVSQLHSKANKRLRAKLTNVKRGII